MESTTVSSPEGAPLSAPSPVRSFGCESVLLPSGWAEDVVIVVNDQGTIVAVETANSRSVDRAAAQSMAQRNVEWLRGAVVPGMANVHSHAHQRLMAGLAERSSPSRSDDPGRALHDTFWTWREVMFSFVERLNPEQLEIVAEQAYVEMLEAGFTAVGEFQYLHNQASCGAYENPAELSLRCLEAARTAGIACTMLPVLYSRGGFDGRELQGGQRRFETSVTAVLDIVERLDAVLDQRRDRATLERVGLAPHSLRAVGLSDLKRAVSSFRSGHPTGPVHLHIAEQVAEVDDCLSHSGQRPVDRLIQTMADTSSPVDASWCLIHSTHLTDAERLALAETKAVVGLCPTTEANLGDGIFPARRFLREGGSLAIGSDSQIRISVAEELRQLETSQRLRDRERNVLAQAPDQSTGRALFVHAAANGGRALSQPMGELAEGQRADFVVLNPDHDRLVGRSCDGLIDSWIFAGDNHCVRDVYVGGTKRVDNGRHIDRDRISHRFRATVQELLEEA